MNEAQFIKEISRRIGESEEEIRLMNEAFASVVVEACKTGDAVGMPGMGTFEGKLRPERIVTTPTTGSRVLLPPRLQLIFKATNHLKQRINNVFDNE